MATRTLLQMINDVGDELELRETGTATSTSTTAVTLANYPFRTNRTNASNRPYEGREMYLQAQASNVTPNPNGVGAYVASTGVMTPSNTYANAPSATPSVDFFDRGVRRQQIIDAINQSLRQMRYRTLVPLTLVDDGDMAVSGTGSWTSSNATLSKVTNSNAIRGPQSLRVLATAAAGYAQSGTILVDATYNRDWFVEALVRADVGDATLRAWNVSTGAAILSETWSNRGWGKLNFVFSLPSTCEALAFRLISVANADDSYWNYVMAYPLNLNEIALPTWVNLRSHVINVLTDLEADRWDKPRMIKRSDWELRGDESNPNQTMKLWLDKGTKGPVWLDGLRSYDTLSADGDTTYCDREWLIAAATTLLLRRLKNRPPTEDTKAWQREYTERRKQLIHWNEVMLAPPALHLVS